MKTEENMTLREVIESVSDSVMPCQVGKPYNVVCKAVMKVLKKRQEDQERKSKDAPRPK